MDIGSLMGNVSMTQKTALENSAANKLSSNMKSDYSGASDEELMDACKQFESYFIEQMFKEMWKTVPTKQYSTNAQNTMDDFYHDQMIQKYAEMTTDQGGYGLAQMLYEQMKRTGESASSVDVDTAKKADEAMDIASKNSAIV